MKHELILSRSVEVETWRIQGSVAGARACEYIMPVLQCLAEFNKCTARDLAQHLLFDDKGRVVVAERLLEITRLYGLTESENGQYMLSDDGYEALNKKEVFIPNDGCWELSVSNDSLLPHIIINIEAFNEPNAKSELIGEDDKSKLDARRQKMMSLPEWVKASIGIETILHAGGKKRIDIIEDKAEKIAPKTSLTIEWNVSKGKVRLLNKNEVLNQFDGPELSQNDVWEILLRNEDLFDGWDGMQNNLAISFGKVDDQARKRMIDDFEFNSPYIEYGELKYGIFKNCVVEGVALRAATEGDAKEWANWRLNESINSFATTKKYKAWTRKAWKPFEYFDIALPKRDVYAQERWNMAINIDNKTKDWYMIAAADWAL